MANMDSFKCIPEELRAPVRFATVKQISSNEKVLLALKGCILAHIFTVFVMLVHITSFKIVYCKELAVYDRSKCS